MTERTAEDILSKAPIEVTLGSEKYPIRPLTILKARAWRLRLTEQLKTITESFAQPSEKGNLGPALTSALIRFPEKLAELVFSYDESLPKDKILEEATEEQIATAFSAIMKLTFPFLGQLTQTVQVVKSNL